MQRFSSFFIALLSSQKKSHTQCKIVQQVLQSTQKTAVLKRVSESNSTDGEKPRRLAKPEIFLLILLYIVLIVSNDQVMVKTTVLKNTKIEMTQQILYSRKLSFHILMYMKS